MTPNLARLDELLATEATQTLTPAEARELASLLAANPGVDRNSFAYAAAALDRVMSGPGEPMPAHLAEKLLLASAVLVPVSSVRPKPVRGERPAWIAWAGWIVAAALLIYTNWPRPQPIPPGPTPPGPAAPDFAKMRDELKSHPSAKSFADAKASASATVVWSDQKKEGYLEVRGLPALDPTKEQYQLWIVDAARKDKDHSQPVSGGVFDVKPDGTVLIPINPAIKVTNATVFAVTKETAGGVTVSKGPMLLVMTQKQG